MNHTDVRETPLAVPSETVVTDGHAQKTESVNERRKLDPESAAWVNALENSCGPEYELACTRLHELLVRIAMGEMFRRGSRRGRMKRLR